MTTFTQGHALLIGVGSHEHHPHLDVPITVADAQAVQAVLQNPTLCGYPPEQVCLLSDNQATAAGICQALDNLRRLDPDHTLFLFFAGHGALGTDGNYHLLTHDAQITGGKVTAGTGLSQELLLEKLRAIPARRCLMIFNACHSAHIGPGTLAPAAPFPTLNPSGKTAHALLGAGEGRILIVAARKEQYSHFIPEAKTTFFTQKLVEGLEGEASASGGYIGAFGLYEYLYHEVKEAVQAKYGQTQEPVLTAVQTVGSFPVALYRGATALGALEEDTVAPGTAVNWVEEEEAKQAFKSLITIIIGVPIEDFEHLPPEAGDPPYQGLHYFEEKDADWFFGRERVTAVLVNRLHETNFVAVVGDSGSGKSSIVRAGVVPAMKRVKSLADGSVPPPGEWQIRVMTPTAQPLAKLAATLFPDDKERQAELYSRLFTSPNALRDALSKQVTQERVLLLVIDQFEELFSQCKDEQQRESFIVNLVTAVQPTCKIILTLRADFYAPCLHYEPLRRILKEGQEPLGPMNREELRAAILGPAAKGGWKVQEGLAEEMLEDVGQEPGALPLLSHALRETWERRRGRVLTLSGYRALGGVKGAIAQTAEGVYQNLMPDEQALAQQIFLRLTELGEGATDTRRRVALSELITRSHEQRQVEAVLKKLADARLITTSKSTVEIAHEAIIREWPALRQWLKENRTGLLLLRHLTEAAHLWATHGYNPTDLYRGTRLADVVEWANYHTDTLNSEEREFLKASLAEQKRQEDVTGWVDKQKQESLLAQTVLREGQAQYLRNGSLLLPEQLEMLRAQSKNPYLRFTDDDLRFILLSAITHRQEEVWLAAVGQKGPDWLQTACLDENCPLPTRRQIAAYLGEVEDREIWRHWVDAVPVNGRIPKVTWELMIHYLRCTPHQLPPLPWKVWQWRWPSLLQLLATRETATRKTLRRAAIYAVTPAVALQTVLFNENLVKDWPGHVLNFLIFSLVGTTIALILAETISALSLLIRGLHRVSRAAILATASFPIGWLLFIFVVGTPRIWLASGIVGATLGLLLDKPRALTTLTRWLVSWLAALAVAGLAAYLTAPDGANNQETLIDQVISATASGLFTLLFLYFSLVPAKHQA
jgi:hypothetical protein